MVHRPHPNPRRALRHIVRGYRVARQAWPGRAATCVEVRVYPGLVTQGIEAELRGILSKERRLRGGPR